MTLHNSMQYSVSEALPVASAVKNMDRKLALNLNR
jgi:hypothetical protein